MADKEPLYEHNRVTLADAITAYTAGSAYVNHLDETTGRIEVGYYADLAILDRDVFAHPTEQIAEAKVVATYVEGERVYSAS